MGRPSVADARRQQILEAALRCISANGLAATTLDGIAAEAGMARGHVRHFAGNRDEILLAAAMLLYFGEVPDRELARSGTHTGSYLPAGTDTVEAALDYLFGELAEPGPENVAALAFVDAARTDDRIRAIVVRAYLSSETELRALLAAHVPHAPDARVAQAAYGVLTIALGNAFMSDIQVSPEHTALARQNAQLVIDALAAADRP